MNGIKPAWPPERHGIRFIVPVQATRPSSVRTQGLVLRNTGAVFEPLKVGAGIGVETASSSTSPGLPGGIGHNTAVGFGVSFGRRKITAAVVVVPWEVPPFVFLQFVHEKAVIDRIGVF